MFLIPQPVKCPKCGYECFSEPNYPSLLSDYCPKCTEEFFNSVLPRLEKDESKDREPWKRTIFCD